MKLIGNAHAHVTVGGRGSAFGVERYKVERCADLASRIVGAAQTMVQKVPREFPAAARGVGAAHFRRG